MADLLAQLAVEDTIEDAEDVLRRLIGTGRHKGSSGPPPRRPQHFARPLATTNWPSGRASCDWLSRLCARSSQALITKSAWLLPSISC